MQPTKFLIAIFALATFGCSAVNPTEGFNEIEALTAAKFDAKLIWNTDQEAAKKIETAIKELLAHPLSVSDVVQIALLNSPAIQAVYEDVGVAQADLMQAGLLQNPIFQLERRFPGKALEFDIVQDFVDIFFIPLRTKVAENALEATKLKVASAVIEHAAKTKVVFYELQSGLQTLEMLRSVSQTMDASALAARRLYEAGNVKELDMQAEHNLANEARLALVVAESEVIAEREKLNVLMGLWSQNITWKIEDRLPAPPAIDTESSGLERLAILERLDLASERKDLDALGSNINLLGYGAILTEATLSFHSETEPGGDVSRGPSISLPIPLFNQGDVQRARAYAKFRQSAAHFMQHAVEIRSEVRRAFVLMRSARQRVEFLQTQVLPLKAKILEQTQLQYNGMFMSLFQLLQAKRAQFEAGKEYIETLETYWVARTELELAVGGRIKDVASREFTSTQSSVQSPPNALSPVHQHKE